MAGSKKGTPRHRWTDNEMGKVIDATVDLAQTMRVRDGVTIQEVLGGFGRFIGLVRDAQACLTPARQKKLFSDALLKSLKRSVGRRLNNDPFPPNRPELREPSAPTPEPTPERQADSGSPLAIGLAFEHLARGLGQSFGQAFGQALGAALAEPMRAVVTDALKAIKANGAQPPEQIASDVTELKGEFGDLPSKFHRPKVFCYPLLPEQQKVIAGAFKHVDFRFADQSLKHAQVGEIAKRCDHCFIMIKFVSHSGQEAVRRNAPDHYSFVNGGLSNLQQLIRARYGADAIERASGERATAH